MDDVVGVYQKDGGLVDAALGNSTHVQLAMAHGATIIDNCPVTRIEKTQDRGVKVKATSYNNNYYYEKEKSG